MSETYKLKVTRDADDPTLGHLAKGRLVFVDLDTARRLLRKGIGIVFKPLPPEALPQIVPPPVPPHTETKPDTKPAAKSGPLKPVDES